MLKWILPLLFLLAPSVCLATSFGELRRAVFKIRVTSQSPNFSQPWQKKAAFQSSGTGFFIGEGRVMTNAHVVANATFITIQRDGEDEKTMAYVEHIAHDCDLAILKVKEPDFFKGVETFKFGGLPRLRTPVAAIGYPMGGDQVSITEGVVSRIDFRRYAHSGYVSHLLIQVDSAINPGNSGGPVVQGHKVIGVAFQGHTAAENTGYIIPTAVVNRFLKDIEDGVYDGHPVNEIIAFGDLMGNESMRTFYGLTEEQGVLVTHVPKFSPFYGQIEKHDIILEVGGQKVGSDGKIVFQGERVNYEVIYDLRQKGDAVTHKVLREGKEVSVNVIAGTDNNYYYAGDKFTPYPRFFAHSGFAFVALSRNYLQAWGRKWYQSAPQYLRFLHYMGNLQPEDHRREEYIVLTKKMQTPLTQYILVNESVVVDQVNGTTPKNMNEFADAIRNNKEDYVVINFLNDDQEIVIPREALAMNEKINKYFGIEPDHWLGSPLRDATTEWKVTRDTKSH